MNKIVKSLAVAFSFVAVSLSGQAQTVQEGLKYLDAEQFSKAKTTFEKIAQAAPTEDNYFHLGYYHLKMGELNEAKAAFDKGVAVATAAKSKLFLNQIGLATLKLAQKDRTGAKTDFEFIVKETKSKNPDVLFRIGEAYTLFGDCYDCNDPAEAVRLIDLALEKKKDANYYIAKGDAFYIKNDGGPAMTAYETALSLNTANASKIRTRMGKLWMQGKIYPDAKANYEKAIEADANFAPAYRQFGEYYVTFQKYEKAAEMFKKYLDLADTDDAAKLRYAKLAFTAKDFTNALTTLNEIKGRVQDPIVSRLIGHSLFEMGKPTEAIAQIQDFLSKASADRILGMDYGYIGRAYAAIEDAASKTKNDSLAFLNMEKAISMKDSSFNYFGKMGEMYFKVKNYAKSAEAYKRSIDATSKPAATDYFYYANSVYNHAYRVAKDSASHVAAIKAWDKVAEVYRDATPASVYYNQGISMRTIEGVNARGGVLPYYESFIKAAAKDATRYKANLISVYNYLANYQLLITKDTLKASEYYNETLKLDPANAEATQGLASLSATATTTAPIKN